VAIDLFLEQEQHWERDLNVLALAGLLVRTADCCYSPLTYIYTIHLRAVSLFSEAFLLFATQVFIGSFSLGMGGIPWVIMSEVINSIP
jgi:MFS transporter, SP family, ERD6-like sugar transporter